ncbi:Endonuclease/exonuclease/phosphatase [Trema orientale]|uniref:Endonuclease/exonuclease/phosphatase n=1 Tax=Trema orientale TaxID=63057 RepID=A0A2P5E8J6_TREOI|nr:Endonuclease/exonuclease/phosphatase [Trema orientale]
MDTGPPLSKPKPIITTTTTDPNDPPPFCKPRVNPKTRARSKYKGSTTSITQERSQVVKRKERSVYGNEWLWMMYLTQWDRRRPTGRHESTNMEGLGFGASPSNTTAPESCMVSIPLTSFHFRNSTLGKKCSTAKKRLGYGTTWRFTSMYGHPVRNQHHHSWELLRRLSIPWVCSGDFNEILSWKEKVGGNNRAWRDMERFREKLLMSKNALTGFVASPTWASLFDSYGVQNLDFWGSDHRAIQLVLDCKEMEGTLNITRGCFFKFERY